MHALDNLSFKVIMKSGVPVVSKEAFEALNCFVEEGRKSQARNFGKSLYFVCEMCQKITLLKYAVKYKGMLVSSKFLRKYQRQKIKDQALREKYELKKQARKAKSEQEYAKIKEDHELLKLKVKEKLSMVTYAPGELKEAKPYSPQERSPKFTDNSSDIIDVKEYSLFGSKNRKTSIPDDFEFRTTGTGKVEQKYYERNRELFDSVPDFVAGLMKKLGPDGLIENRKKFESSNYSYCDDIPDEVLDALELLGS